jgi:spore coat polysaccharide biosynthesis protein SpsF
MIERVLEAQTGWDLVVATTMSPEDAPVERLCLEMGVKCYRGHPTDLLDRHYMAALESRADAVAKIPSDCPLIDPGVIRKILTHWEVRKGQLDFLSNLHPATYPDGNDVEVVRMDVLETAWKEATRDFEREHTTPFVWEQPIRFRLGNVEWETGLNYSMTHRWTIDYPEDYFFIKTIYDELYHPGRPAFSINRILSFLQQHPEVHRINSKYAGINWYRNHLDELKTISRNEVRLEADNQ